jgi:Arc/MetJ-type ribon-helix-helix transcriptional regulator
MPDRAISVRLDDRADEALQQLISDGMSQSEAIRYALLDAASRRRPKRSLSVEALMLGESEADRRESAEVLAFMESISAPWPDDSEG